MSSDGRRSQYDDGGGSVAAYVRLADVIYPSGRDVQYGYGQVTTPTFAQTVDNIMSRLAAINDSTGTLSQYAYLSAGTVASETYAAPGISLDYSAGNFAAWDRFGRVINQSWKQSSETLDGYSYAYDPAGNRTSRANINRRALDQIYAYDDLNRLTAWSLGGAPQKIWSLDALGNDLGSGTYDPSNQETPTPGNGSSGYDTAGNMTTLSSGQTGIYDAWNRLVEVDDATSVPVEKCQYDGLNRRTVEATAAGRHDFFVSQSDQVLEDRATGFDTNGMVATCVGWGPAVARCTAVQSDGKIVAAGSAVGGQWFALVRYNFDGSLDTSFGYQGTAVTEIGDSGSGVQAIAIQADGKIVVAGSVSFEGDEYIALARFNPDGTLDDSFDSGGTLIAALAGSTACSLAIDAEGRILVAGWAGGSSFALVRFQSNGDLDTGFGSGGVIVTAFYGVGFPVAQSVLIDSSDRIVVAGYGTVGGQYAILMARYLADGTPDGDFGAGGKVVSPLVGNSLASLSAALDSQGRIVVAGLAWNGNLCAYRSLLVRYTPLGAVDTTFGSGGSPLIGDFDCSPALQASLAIDSSDGVLVTSCASGSGADMVVTRYNANGSLDTGFAGSGRLDTSVVCLGGNGQCLAIAPDGKLFVAGADSAYDFVLARYNSDGTVCAGLTTTNQYVWSPRYIDAPVVRDTLDSSGNIVTASRVFYLADANFNVTALVGASGQVLERYSYTPYGVVTAYAPDWGNQSPMPSATYHNTILYAGRELDVAIDLNYNRARYYDAVLERFVGTDPMRADLNTYRYCGNMPTQATDPSGMESLWTRSSDVNFLGSPLSSGNPQEGEGPFYFWIGHTTFSDRSMMPKPLDPGGQEQFQAFNIIVTQTFEPGGIPRKPHLIMKIDHEFENAKQGGKLVTMGADTRAYLGDIDSGPPPHRVKSCAAFVETVAIVGFQPDPKQWFQGSDPGTINGPSLTEMSGVFRLAPPIGVFVDEYLYINPSSIHPALASLPLFESLHIGGLAQSWTSTLPQWAQLIWPAAQILIHTL